VNSLLCVAASADFGLDELRAAAATAATRRGHVLGPWEADASAERDAQAATCQRCGRRVYVRVGAGMSGLAGTAITEACPG
jgi:uncharacterized membrane protein